jgi:hypothetical protein
MMLCVADCQRQTVTQILKMLGEMVRRVRIIITNLPGIIKRIERIRGF